MQRPDETRPSVRPPSHQAAGKGTLGRQQAERHTSTGRRYAVSRRMRAILTQRVPWHFAHLLHIRELSSLLAVIWNHHMIHLAWCFHLPVRDTQHRTAAGLMPSSAERPAGAADHRPNSKTRDRGGREVKGAPTRRHRVSQGDGHSLSNDGAAAASWRAGGGPR